MVTVPECGIPVVRLLSIAGSPRLVTFVIFPIWTVGLMDFHLIPCDPTLRRGVLKLQPASTSNNFGCYTFLAARAPGPHFPDTQVSRWASAVIAVQNGNITPAS